LLKPLDVIRSCRPSDFPANLIAGVTVAAIAAVV